MSATERTMLDLLHDRYDFVRPGTTARRYVVAEHPHSTVGWNSEDRIADFVAVDCFSEPTLGTPTVHWHEVKVSRSDWLRELAEPRKSEPWRRIAHYWWLVVPDRAIVRDDLPDGWGLLVVGQQYGRPALRARPKARLQTPGPMGLSITAALMRAAVRTEARRAAEHRLTPLERHVLNRAKQTAS